MSEPDFWGLLPSCTFPPYSDILSCFCGTFIGVFESPLGCHLGALADAPNPLGLPVPYPLWGSLGAMHNGASL